MAQQVRIQSTKCGCHRCTIEDAAMQPGLRWSQQGSWVTIRGSIIFRLQYSWQLGPGRDQLHLTFRLPRTFQQVVNPPVAP